MLALIPFGVGFVAIIIYNTICVSNNITIPSPFNILGIQFLIASSIYFATGFFRDDDTCMCFDCQKWKLGGFMMFIFGIFALIIQLVGAAFSIIS